MAENKTQPTAVPVEEFLASVPERRRRESWTLIEMMREISGEEPVMWGPSIIGFGTHHYRYASGREGTTGVLGFSPRKAALTLYFLEGFEPHQEALARLGRHRTSVSCLYLTRLEDADLQVLGQMLRSSHDAAIASSAEAQG